jgi:hypothetical protein
MFQPSNVDQAQGMQAASVVMMVSPLAEAGAAAAVEAVGMGARVEAGATAVPTGVQANKAVGIEGRGLLCQLLPALDDDIDIFGIQLDAVSRAVRLGELPRGWFRFPRTGRTPVPRAADGSGSARRISSTGFCLG